MNRLFTILAVCCGLLLCAVPDDAEAQRFRLFKRQSVQQCHGPECHKQSTRTSQSPKAAKATPKGLWPFSDNSVVPTDFAERNAWVAAKLNEDGAGHNRANYGHQSGVSVDNYQSRGKERIAWAISDADWWGDAVLRALRQKFTTGASRAGVTLVGHMPPDVVEVCLAADLWLTRVDPETGALVFVIYGNAKPTPAPSDEATDDGADEVEPAPDAEPAVPDTPSEPADEPDPLPEPLPEPTE